MCISNIWNSLSLNYQVIFSNLKNSELRIFVTDDLTLFLPKSDFEKNCVK